MQLRFLQNNPRLLEQIYDLTVWGLTPFKRWLKPGTRVERFFVYAERKSKGAIFNCKMCGQCILHSTGMTCPMNCPKNLRNGPCGGVRLDGRCEVLPHMPCVWVQAWDRSKQMPHYGQEIHLVMPPLNRALHRTSAWINDFTGVADQVPAGWNE
jgi:hypothetical protein